MLKWNHKQSEWLHYKVLYILLFRLWSLKVQTMFFLQCHWNFTGELEGNKQKLVCKGMKDHFFCLKLTSLSETLPKISQSLWFYLLEKLQQFFLLWALGHRLHNFDSWSILLLTIAFDWWMCKNSASYCKNMLRNLAYM